VGLELNHHDRDTGLPSRDPTSLDGPSLDGPSLDSRSREALSAALHRLRLDGAIFFRAEFTDSWAYQSPTSDEVAQILRPGAKRLIIFHIVAAGGCWVRRGDGERLSATEGDVVVLPYGDQHSMGGPGSAPETPILSLLDPPPWQTLPVLRHGAGGSRTDVVCGYLHSEHPLFNPALRALPPVFVVRPTEGPAARWIRSSVEYALAASEPTPDVDPSTRLPELVLTEVLRQYLSTATAVDSGWLAALADPVLAPAMARLHAQPDQRWTVEQLATSVAVSRSLLDERFRSVLGRSPIRYLTDWRMHLAEELLATTRHPVGTIARRVGYDSEEAFSRAFKRLHTLPPAAWRREHVATVH
jgi:AraC-like DNA-binding protein